MWAQGSQLASELWQEPPRAWGADLGGRQSLAQPGTPALLGGESSWVPPKRGYAETVVAVRKVLNPMEGEIMKEELGFQQIVPGLRGLFFLRERF